MSIQRRLGNLEKISFLESNSSASLYTGRRSSDHRRGFGGFSLEVVLFSFIFLSKINNFGESRAAVMGGKGGKTSPGPGPKRGPKAPMLWRRDA